MAPRPDAALPPPSMEDWNDLKWKDVKWTVYRDVAYDMKPFYDKHPGGNWLLNLSIGRDCTALIESYHLRPEFLTRGSEACPSSRISPGRRAQVASSERLPPVQLHPRARAQGALSSGG